MYQKFFGFEDKPFEVTPDPKFLYLTRTYQEILSALIYGIHERRGFIAIVGEVGTGKTLILNALLDRLEHDTKAAFIFNSDLTFRQMLIMALYDLGLAGAEENLSKIVAIQRLNEFAIQQLERGGNVVIIVDEAQSLSHKTMENLRMLSNLETRKHKLVQIVLSGQPELDAKLNNPEWRQLVQRISLKRYSTELSEEDTYSYVEHRLKVAGYEGSPLFSKKALKLIWEYSGGIPRKINVLCDNVLLIGYGLETKRINEEIVNEAINDLSWSPYLNDTGSQGLVTEDRQALNPEQEEPVATDIQVQNPEDAINDISEDLEVLNSEWAQMPTAEEIQTRYPVEKAPFLFGETLSSEDEEALNKAKKTLFHRIRSTLFAGFLILVCLTVAAWFLISKSWINLGDVNPHNQKIIHSETFDPKRRSSSQIVDQKETSKGKQAEASLKVEPKKLLK
jgi:type II secretory pathway predicted ATPase ExeA